MDLKKLLGDFNVIAANTCHPLYLSFDILREKIEVPRELVPEILELIKKHHFGEEVYDDENYF